MIALQSPPGLFLNSQLLANRITADDGVVFIDQTFESALWKPAVAIAPKNSESGACAPTINCNLITPDP
jgi:hypothetical protein